MTRTSFGQRRFYEEDGQWYQRSSVTKDLTWPLKQVKDIVTPGSKVFNEKAMYAKTVRKDGHTYGPVSGESIYILTSKSALPIPTPPTMRNRGKRAPKVVRPFFGAPSIAYITN